MLCYVGMYVRASVFGGIDFAVIFTKQLELLFVPTWFGTVAFTATEMKTIPTD